MLIIVIAKHKENISKTVSCIFQVFHEDVAVYATDNVSEACQVLDRIYCEKAGVIIDTNLSLEETTQISEASKKFDARIKNLNLKELKDGQERIFKETFRSL